VRGQNDRALAVAYLAAVHFAKKAGIALANEFAKGFDYLQRTAFPLLFGPIRIVKSLNSTVTSHKHL
jgi:hypothetical protein